MVTTGLMDAMLVQGAPADLVAALAEPLPRTVVCELLGIPEQERAPLFDFSRAISIAEGFDPDEFAAIGTAASQYLLGLIDRKRDNPTEDVLSALVQVHDEDGVRLTADEMVMTVILLFGAGQESTMSQLGKSVLLLLSRYPDQWARLVAAPELVPGAVEELLRVIPLGPATQPRMATEDVMVSDEVLTAGTTVFPIPTAANRDPAVFPDPDRFDIERPEAAQHLTFGRGLHFCIGAPMARMELQIALHNLVTRTPGLRMADLHGEPDWLPETATQLVRTLPVVW
ncbi:MAG TPA: cytochrome P450 [Pseudonocardiaceae bacterium]|jgi:cytochrome P450